MAILIHHRGGGRCCYVVAGSDVALVLAGFAQPASVEWPAEWDPAKEKIGLECCLFVHWRKQPSAAAVAEGPTQ